MDLRMRVEVDNFNRAMASIGKVTDDPNWQKKVIDFEVAKILEVTMQRTQRATIASIKRSQASRGPWRTYDLGKGRKKYFLENRYPNAIWRAIQTRLAASLKRKTDAREFARQAWLYLANALGFTVKTTAQTKGAKIGGVDNRSNIRGSRAGGVGKYGIELENNSPLIRYSEGAQAIFSAIKGRRRYFEESMRKTYVDRIKPLAERYGLTVK